MEVVLIMDIRYVTTGTWDDYCHGRHMTIGIGLVMIVVMGVVTFTGMVVVMIICNIVGMLFLGVEVVMKFHRTCKDYQ